jgi:hypothetical protein
VAPNIKNSKNNGIINPLNWSTRVPSTTDSAPDFYNRYNCSFRGFVYSDGSYTDQNGKPQTISGGNYNTASPALIMLPVGPYNEITLQKIGTAGTVVIKGSLIGDTNNLVTCNLVTSADGLIRIQSLYKYIVITATGLDNTSQLYMQIW